MKRTPVVSALILLSLSSQPSAADCPAQMTINIDGSSCIGGQHRWYMGWDANVHACGWYTQATTNINRILNSAQWGTWVPSGSYWTGPIPNGMCILAPGGKQYRAWSDMEPQFDIINTFWTSASYPLPYIECDQSQ